MDGKKTNSITFSMEVKVDCHVMKTYVFCICSGGIYHIKLKSLPQIHESIFQPIISLYAFVFLYKFLVYRGFYSIVTHASHLSFQ